MNVQQPSICKYCISTNYLGARDFFTLNGTVKRCSIINFGYFYMSQKHIYTALPPPSTNINIYIPQYNCIHIETYNFIYIFSYVQFNSLDVDSIMPNHAKFLTNTE